MFEGEHGSSGQGLSSPGARAAFVVSALIRCQGQREGAGTASPRVPLCQSGLALTHLSSSAKPWLITSPSRCLLGKPRYPHFVKKLGPEKNQPGGNVLLPK